jgi:hypothetical protein
MGKKKKKKKKKSQIKHGRSIVLGLGSDTGEPVMTREARPLTQSACRETPRVD